MIYGMNIAEILNIRKVRKWRDYSMIPREMRG